MRALTKNSGKSWKVYVVSNRFETLFVFAFTYYQQA